MINPLRRTRSLVAGFAGFLILVMNLSLSLAQRTYRISTSSGAASVLNGYTGDGGPAAQARLNEPGGLARAQNGDLYISDTWNHVVRKIDGAGLIRTVAGTGVEGYDGDAGPAIKAKLSYPAGIAFDSHGNLYVAETKNNRIRRVRTDGVIETFAGTGETGYEGDGGPAIKAKLSRPDGLVIDKSDVLYFSDSANNSIRRITSDGMIGRLAGTPGLGTFDRRNVLASPRGLAFDSSGALYVADREHHRIVKIDSDGVVHHVAGNGSMGRSSTGEGDGGQAVDASIPYPMSVAFDVSGDLLVVGSGRVRRIDKAGQISSVFGARLDLPPSNDPLQTRITPTSLLVDPAGALFVSDSFRHRVYRLDVNHTLSVFAGLNDLPNEVEGGPAEFVRYSSTDGVAVGPTGDIYIADAQMNRICRITTDGKFYKVAGKGLPILRIEGFGSPPQFSGDGGPATLADLDGPNGVAIDAEANVYISDSNNNRIRKVTPDGLIHTIAGTGEKGFGGDGGPATAARLAHPMGLAVDQSGNLYIADREK